jgi:hypothetical protein
MRKKERENGEGWKGDCKEGKGELDRKGKNEWGKKVKGEWVGRERENGEEEKGRSGKKGK